MDKTLTLEQIKNMSTDDMISLYRQGYVLENSNVLSLENNNFTIETLEGDPNCLVPSPFGGCLLSKYAANMALTVMVLVLGAFIVYKVVKKSD